MTKRRRSISSKLMRRGPGHPALGPDEPLPRTLVRDRPFRVLVHGVPVPQGSMGIKKFKQRSHSHLEHSAELYEWRERVGAAAFGWMRFEGYRHAFDGPLELHATFYLPHRGKETRHPHRKPDLDKLLRAVNDALEAWHVIEQDSRIVCLFASKEWSPEPGVLLELRPAE